MLLSAYLQQRGAARALARRLGVSDVMVSQWKAGIKTPGPELAMQIELATDGAVRRWESRPADWHRIWAELIDHPDAPMVPEVSALQVADA